MTSLLTLYALVKAWNKAFWQPVPENLPPVRLPRRMVGSTAVLVSFGVIIAVFAGPLYGYTERAAALLRDRGQYVLAVLPDGQRGEGESADVTENASGGAGEPAADVVAATDAGAVTP